MEREQLLEIFNTLKSLLQPYEKGAITARQGSPGKYELWSEKEIIVQGRKHKEVFFASAGIQGNYVGFYFMPVYTNDIKTQLAPELLKCLKGKACFHIKTTDAALMKQVKDALKKGYEQYKKNGWV